MKEEIIWETKKVKLKDLKTLENNPRRLTDEGYSKLDASVGDLGNFKPLIVDTDLTIIGGNQRYRVLEANSYDEVEVSVPSRKLTNKERQKIIVLDNTHAGEFDLDILANEYEDVLKELDLDFGIEWEETKEAEEDNFEIPKEAKYKVEQGDIYELGNHRLMCGDSTKIEDVEKLMNGEEADMVFTDPPYGVSFSSNRPQITAKFDVIKNDNTILSDWIAPVLMFSTGWVLFCTTWKVLKEWLEIGSQIGELTNMIIWDKGGGGIGDLEKTLSTDYEIILAYSRKNQIAGKRIGSVWSVGKDSANKYIHPTQKPVQLPALAINTLSTGAILDLFGGSGSTLIACEQLNRKCFMMELDTYYCSVIIERWEKLTGKTAKKLKNN